MISGDKWDSERGFEGEIETNARKQGLWVKGTQCSGQHVSTCHKDSVRTGSPNAVTYLPRADILGY